MELTRSILLVEEDEITRTFLADNLTADGYDVIVAHDKPSALAKLAGQSAHLVLCDVNGQTLELLDAVRGAPGLAGQVDPDVPLIILTARRDELARVRYLERGGDDVIAKPFCYPELRARIAVALRRAYAPRHGRIVQAGPLRIDHHARSVHVHGTPVELAAKEYALLARLAGDPAKVFTKDELLRDVWGFRARASTRTLDSHAIRLRHKLHAAGGSELVQTVWGVGYRLTPVAPARPEGEAA